MVAERTSKLYGHSFFRSHRGAIPYIVIENEILNRCLFSKAKKKTKKKTNANKENVCIGRRFIRVYDVFEFGRNWLLIGKSRVSISNRNLLMA